MVYLQTAQPFLWEGVPQRDVFYAEVGSVFNKAVGDTVVVVGATGSDALYFGCIGVGHVNIGKYLVAHFGVVHGDLGNAGSFFQQVAVTHGIGEGAANQVDSLVAHRAVQEDVEVKSFIRKVVVEAEREFGCRIAEESHEEELEDHSEAARIQELLHALREPYKEVFMWRVYGEKSFRDIGALFGKTENWACVTYHRAKRMIREGLEDD